MLILRYLAPETSGELDIFLLYSDPPRMNRTKIGVFKERGQVSLNRLLQSANSGRLEA